jgi:hypothetical protein
MVSELTFDAVLGPGAVLSPSWQGQAAHPLVKAPSGLNAWEAVMASEEAMRRLGGMGPPSNEARALLSALAQTGPRTVEEAMEGYPTHRQAVAMSAFHTEVARLRKETSGIDPRAETLALGGRFLRGLTEMNTMRLGFGYAPEQAKELIAEAKRSLTFSGSAAEQAMLAAAKGFVAGTVPYAQVVELAQSVAAPASPAFQARATVAPVPVFEDLAARRQRLLAEVSPSSRPRHRGPGAPF